jgi:hypothetical protein
VLAGATATVCAIGWWTRGLPAYAAAAAWAFVGAAIGAAGAGEQVLVVASAVGLVAVTVTRLVRTAAVTA